VAARKSVLLDQKEKADPAVVMKKMVENASIPAPVEPVAPAVQVAVIVPEASVMKTAEMIVAPEPATAKSNSGNNPKDSICSTTSGDSIWMEVSSPMRSPEKESEREDTNADDHQQQQQQQLAALENPRPRTESDASFQSCASSGSNVPKSSNSHTSSSTAAKASTASGATSVRPISSKLASYQTEKTGVVKSVVSGI
jgi:hypothetical protein